MIKCSTWGPLAELIMCDEATHEGVAEALMQRLHESKCVGEDGCDE